MADEKEPKKKDVGFFVDLLGTLMTQKAKRPTRQQIKNLALLQVKFGKSPPHLPEKLRRARDLFIRQNREKFADLL